jgi:asparagine N-glycosylation enzyme membrane subunit Stt3
MLFLTPFQLTLPFGVALLVGFPKRLGKTSEPAHVEVSRASVRGALLAVVFTTGFLLAWTPMQLRLVPIILVLPAVVGLLLAKSGSQEKELVGTLALVSLLLVAFNYATRGLVQLLIDPHNYTP